MSKNATLCLGIAALFLVMVLTGADREEIFITITAVFMTLLCTGQFVTETPRG